MPYLPTLIILAAPDECRSDRHTDAPWAKQGLTQFDGLQHAIHKGLVCQMPMLLVAQAGMARHAQTLLPPEQIIEVSEATPDQPQRYADQMAQGVASAVGASANASGWLLLTAETPMIQVETLKTMGSALADHPIVFPEYRCRRGHPVGFSAEFFSELISLKRERDLQRLISRYPAWGVEVDDAGVLLSQHPLISPEQFQAHAPSMLPPL